MVAIICLWVFYFLRSILIVKFYLEGLALLSKIGIIILQRGYLTTDTIYTRQLNKSTLGGGNHGFHSFTT